jgi:hypothetical protein
VAVTGAGAVVAAGAAGASGRAGRAAVAGFAVLVFTVVVAGEAAVSFLLAIPAAVNPARNSAVTAAAIRMRVL